MITLKFWYHLSTSDASGGNNSDSSCWSMRLLILSTLSLTPLEVLAWGSGRTMSPEAPSDSRHGPTSLNSVSPRTWRLSPSSPVAILGPPDSPGLGCKALVPSRLTHTPLLRLPAVARLGAGGRPPGSQPALRKHAKLAPPHWSDPAGRQCYWGLALTPSCQTRPPCDSRLLGAPTLLDLRVSSSLRLELRNQLEPKLALVLIPTLHPRGQTSLVSQHCMLLNKLDKLDRQTDRQTNR